jgi:hypothetical protein
LTSILEEARGAEPLHDVDPRTAAVLLMGMRAEPAARRVSAIDAAVAS